MIHGTLTITFEHYWHCGSGQAGDGDVDATPVVENCGLPYVPGRALRGRLKWAAREAEWAKEKIERFFGTGDSGGENEDGIGNEGAIALSSGFMKGPFPEHCRKHFTKHGSPTPETAALFEDIASTSLEDGVARKRSLRRVRYSVPVSVSAEISLDETRDDCSWEDLEALVNDLRAVGRGKHDGYGWCQATLEQNEGEGPSRGSLTDDSPAVPPITSEAQPSRPRAYQLTLELLDDLVLSASNATVGGHRTLDHIPGSAILGVFARAYFPTLKEELPYEAVEKTGATTFLAGKVSFGAATPAGSNCGTLPLPLSWHHAKDEAATSENRVDREKISNLASTPYLESRLAGLQPVQMREGWLDTRTGELVSVTRREMLKTAINENLDRYETAAQGQLFGYEAIQQGARLVATIEVEDDDALVHQALTRAFENTTIRIGRSKGTEFGRVRATLVPATEGIPSESQVEACDTITLLAESDLALLDDRGVPTLVPSPAHFGLDDRWALCQERSFLRHRRYALWNAKRNGPDLERQVITKGSVIVFRTDEASDASVNLRVGTGRAEGLGRVRLAESWWNDETPRFESSPDSESSAETAEPASKVVFTVCDDDTFGIWISHRYEEKRFDLRADRLGKKWANEWRRAMRRKRASLSPSQWGRLEEAARSAKNKSALGSVLGDGKPDERGEKTLFGHGKKQEEWGKGVAIAVLSSLEKEKNNRLALAAFRVACRDIAAKQRQNRS